jgi:PAS domain S-box-containing protein
MQQIFRPAVALMYRLKYPQKFALISLLFAVPLVLTLALFVQEINSKIDFAQKELHGDAYLRSLHELFKHALQEKMIAYDYANGNITSKDELLNYQSRIDEDFRRLEAIDRELGSDLKTTDELSALKAEWADLKNRTPMMRARMSMDMRTSFIAHIRALISLVGDTSNLILDPDLDSYYLMDAVLLKLPESQELLVQTEIFGEPIVSQQSIAIEQKVQLITLSGLLQSNIDATKRGLNVAFNNNPDRNLSSLQKPLQEYLAANEDLLKNLRLNIINARRINITSEAYRALVIKALESNFALWDLAITRLDELLQARVDEFNQKKVLALSVTAVVLALVGYAWVAFYMAVRHTVSSLEAAARRMIDGAMAETVQLEVQDELGQIVRSFNAIATALISASAERQAVVDNAVDGIMTISAQGIIESFNPAAERIFGYPAAEVIGQPISVLIPEPYHDQYRMAGVGREVLGRRKDGTLFPLDLAVGEMHLDGRHTFIGMAHDLTERKRAEAERARLQEEIIRAQAAMLAELSTPLIPITDQVMVMPLIGGVDSQRAQRVMETLLKGIEQHRARVAILDITGVPIVDTQVATGLIRAAQAVKLLGAQIVLTGIRPEVAQTLVGLGVDLSGLITQSTLQSGIAYATQRQLSLANGH